MIKLCKNGVIRLKFEWKNCLKAGISIFILYLCIYYWGSFSGLLSVALSAAMPLIIGCVIAYLINILMTFYEKHYFAGGKGSRTNRGRRPICLLLAYLTMLAIIALIIGLVVPQLVSCVKLIISELPDVLKSLSAWLKTLSFVPENFVSVLTSVDWESRIDNIIKVLTSGVGGVMDTVVKTVSSVFSGIITAFISIIFSVYLLASRDKLKNQINRLMDHYLKDSINCRIRYFLSVLNDCFHRYIVGQCTEAVILGVLCTVGMLILRLPYATMIGALVAFTALIPVAGAYIGAFVGAFMILSVSPIKALIFLVFLVILQQLEGNLIYPRVVGSSIGLPGIWVLAAVTLGGGIMGIGGMLIGVPLTAALYRIIKDDINKKPTAEYD